MFGDIKAINAWAKSEKIRSLAIALNTGKHPKRMSHEPLEEVAVRMGKAKVSKRK